MVPENLGRYFYRDNLKSEQAKHLYNEILTYFTHNYSTEVPVTFENMDEASQDIFCAAEALYYDWPELFFIGNSWRFLYTKMKSREDLSLRATGILLSRFVWYVSI